MQGVSGPAPVPSRAFSDRGDGRYAAIHEQVFQALAQAEAQHGGEGVTLDETARTAGLGKDETRTILHDLIKVHHMVTELAAADDPDLGPRYETKPRM